MAASSAPLPVLTQAFNTVPNTITHGVDATALKQGHGCESASADDSSSLNKFPVAILCSKGNAVVDDLELIESGLADLLPDLPLVPFGSDAPPRTSAMAFLTMPQTFAYISSAKCLRTFSSELLYFDACLIPSLHDVDVALARGESLFTLFVPLYVPLVKYLCISTFKQGVKQENDGSDNEASLDENDLQTIQFFEGITSDTVQPYLTDLVWKDPVPLDVFPELFASDTDQMGSSSQRSGALLEILEGSELPMMAPYVHVCLLKLLCDKLLNTPEVCHVFKSLDDRITMYRQARWKRAGERRQLEAELVALEAEIGQLSEKLGVNVKEEASSKLPSDILGECADGDTLLSPAGSTMSTATARQQQVKMNRLIEEKEEEVALELRQIQGEHNRKLAELQKKQSAIDALVERDEIDRAEVEELKSRRRSASSFELGSDRFGRFYHWLDLTVPFLRESTRPGSAKYQGRRSKTTNKDLSDGNESNLSASEENDEDDVGTCTSMDDSDSKTSARARKPIVLESVNQPDVASLDEGTDQGQENYSLACELGGSAQAFGLVVEWPTLQFDYYELPFRKQVLTKKRTKKAKALSERPNQLFAPPRRCDLEQQGLASGVLFEPLPEVATCTRRHHRWFFVPHWLCLESLYQSLDARGIRERELKANIAKKCSEYGVKLGQTLKPHSKLLGDEAQRQKSAAEAFEAGIFRFSDWIMLRGQAFNGNTESVLGKRVLHHYLPLIQDKLTQCARIYRVATSSVPDLEVDLEDSSTQFSETVESVKKSIVEFIDKKNLDLFTALELQGVRSKTTHKPLEDDYDADAGVFDSDFTDDDEEHDRYRHSFYLHRPWNRLGRLIEKKNGRFLELPRFVPLISMKTLGGVYAWLCELSIKASEKGSNALVFKTRQKRGKRGTKVFPKASDSKDTATQVSSSRKSVSVASKNQEPLGLGRSTRSQDSGRATSEPSNAGPKGSSLNSKSTSAKGRGPKRLKSLKSRSRSESRNSSSSASSHSEVHKKRASDSASLDVDTLTSENEEVSFSPSSVKIEADADENDVEMSASSSDPRSSSSDQESNSESGGQEDSDAVTMSDTEPSSDSDSDFGSEAASVDRVTKKSGALRSTRSLKRKKR